MLVIVSVTFCRECIYDDGSYLGTNIMSNDYCYQIVCDLDWFIGGLLRCMVSRSVIIWETIVLGSDRLNIGDNVESRGG